jgi:hypothetical protein
MTTVTKKGMKRLLLAMAVAIAVCQGQAFIEYAAGVVALAMSLLTFWDMLTGGVSDANTAEDFVDVESGADRSTTLTDATERVYN